MAHAVPHVLPAFGTLESNPEHHRCVPQFVHAAFHCSSSIRLREHLTLHTPPPLSSLNCMTLRSELRDRLKPFCGCVASHLVQHHHHYLPSPSDFFPFFLFFIFFFSLPSSFSKNRAYRASSSSPTFHNSPSLRRSSTWTSSTCNHGFPRTELNLVLSSRRGRWHWCCFTPIFSPFFFFFNSFFTLFFFSFLFLLA